MENNKIKLEDPSWDRYQSEFAVGGESSHCSSQSSRPNSQRQRQSAISFQHILNRTRDMDDEEQLLIKGMFPVSKAFTGDPWDLWELDYSQFDWSRAEAKKATRSIEDKVTFGDWDKALLEYGALVQLFRHCPRNTTVTAFLKTMPTGRSLISCESIGRVVEILLAHPVWAVKKMVAFLKFLADANFRKVSSKQGKLEKLFHYLIRGVFEDEDGEEVLERWYDILCYSRMPQNYTKEIFLPCNTSWLYDQYKALIPLPRKQKLQAKMNQIRLDRANGKTSVQWPTREEVILAREILRTDFAEELQMIPRSCRNFSTDKIRDIKRNKFDIYDSPGPVEDQPQSDDDGESSRNSQPRSAIAVELKLETEDSDSPQRKHRRMDSPRMDRRFKLSDPMKLSELIQSATQFGLSLMAMEEGGQRLKFGQPAGENHVTFKENDDATITVSQSDNSVEVWEKSWPMFKYAFCGKLYQMTDV